MDEQSHERYSGVTDKMKYAVVGSRTLDNYEAVALELDAYLGDKPVECIVSGGADGVDKISETYAKNHGIPMKVFEAEWEKYGSTAGPIRNKLIVDFSDVILAFLDSRNSRSWGTKNTIKLAEQSGKPVYVFEI